MNIRDAAHATVHDYDGGSESLGPRMGISAAVLRNKVNPNNETHHLTLNEADRMMGLTGDFRILRALAHAHGFLLVKAPEGSDCDMSVLEAVVETGVAHGQWMQAIHSALADGRVDSGEVQAIKEAKRALQTAAATATQRVEGMAG